MDGHITPGEWERIEAFAQRPSYLRRPEHLLPEAAAEGKEGEEAVASD
ncbi:hypothetical protein SAMN05443574_10795 [Haloarcula vallismortis]|uniref:Uncharacterized protein n=2 Tax=Haloarcula vallismortis TaxID=28442 RepID=M0JN77_HALVA|nr:hypothetical protein [Haloarcula vallismortis]EMA09414.1 hypothetical protein C437_05970 [Haloarcula vallismortis ATCC 29715]SDW82188.1 hypothetical protein SAMN05443574_10795 [Haloarcula vallismortis]